MTEKFSPAAVFVFVHRWLVASIVLLMAGLIGASAMGRSGTLPPTTAPSRLQGSFPPARAAQIPMLTPEQSFISTASGIFLFLAVVTFIVWLYGLARYRSLLPELNSISLKGLASKKVITVLGTVTGVGVLLYWSLMIVLLATPMFAPAASDFAPYALLLTLIAVISATVLFFLAQGRLLVSWLPSILCPKCQEQISLINYWQCVGGCKANKVRHVLSPCPTCGTRSQGLACTYQCCGEAINFDGFYNEFEVANRSKKYVTQYNTLFWGALLGLEVSLLLLYVCFQAEITILWLLFALLALGSGITLIIAKPKRLISNQHYVEGEQRWTKRATA
jgi:hypothetical protein